MKSLHFVINKVYPISTVQRRNKVRGMVSDRHRHSPRRTLVVVSADDDHPQHNIMLNVNEPPYKLPIFLPPSSGTRSPSFFDRQSQPSSFVGGGGGGRPPFLSRPYCDIVGHCLCKSSPPTHTAQQQQQQGECTL